MRAKMFAKPRHGRTITDMAAGLWIAVGIAGYLVLASLGLLLCRGIALADRAASTGTAKTGSQRRAAAKPMPRPRTGRPARGPINVGSRRAVP